MKSEILKVLRQSSSHVSGQELCERLGVSRTAVWKNIRQLQEEGYQIEAVRNKGYRMVQAPADVFNASEIKSRLGESSLIQEVLYRAETDSTNTWAKRLAEGGSPSGTLAVADRQTQGKGRRGKVWSSPEGTSVYMTLLLRPEILPQYAAPLTLVMGLSVAQALDDTLGLSAGIKWPNDVVVSGKKICGILTEMSAQMDYVDYLVIGTGINVNTQVFPDEIKDMATSAADQLGHIVSRAELAASVIRCFEKNYKVYLDSCSLEGLMEAYREKMINYNREVKVMGPGEVFEGVAKGISPSGELLVERKDGSVTAVSGGEVSVRGLYGYV
ncbi:biotin--[acetyl-CoA-carboxylase] ligase [Ruminococcus sp. OA3]|uniref:biotin--[acetyl-CoA-carboxylase] ligase n=1 Tax=Ruminococcus sp. OA3 TaxID=2914164 RepID=UPI001F05715B|nr:biotin--[acetyl-CoA-carboxylase] ligase [Ruminococcus sp. OA3]MCH1981685.1 biotin--[acetyl-CoA-carboxylase] ligase [Ruminococcus sp. OA3]